MYDFDTILINSINRGKPFEYHKKSVDAFKFNQKIYTGENQRDILEEYRKSETKLQKDQRDRITNTLTKHIVRQIENIYDELRILDKSSINIKHTNEGSEQELKEFLEDNNIESVIFELVKYYNIIDAGAFCVAGLNEYGDIEFRAIGSEQIYDNYIVNNNVKFLVITQKRKVNNNEFTDYILYHDNGIITYYDGKDSSKKTEDNEVKTKKGVFFKDELETACNYAFRLGWKKDPSTNFRTCTSIIDSASKLFINLIWDGSELDVIKATHGIVKTFVYAPRCTHEIENEEGRFTCEGGVLKNMEAIAGECPKCQGNGLKIHTSSQDIIYIEEPLPSTDGEIPLNGRMHTEYIPDRILDIRKKDLEALESKIIKTVFNSNFTTKSDVAVTATEKRIDLKGIYSALGNLGIQVSKAFIWAVNCAADLLDISIDDLTVIHGYALNLKLDDLDSLIEQRAKAVDAGVPMDIINVIDYAIIKKQHIDNPKFLDEFAQWEKFRPFSDKTESERMSLVSVLPEDDFNKVLYLNFKTIKQDILNEVKGFYDLTHAKQKELITKKVEELTPEVLPLGRTDFTDFD